MYRESFYLDWDRGARSRDVFILVGNKNISAVAGMHKSEVANRTLCVCIYIYIYIYISAVNRLKNVIALITVMNCNKIFYYDLT